MWMMAFRVSGAGVGSVTSGCRREGGFAACIVLARAMVRLPCPVPASKISKGGGREEESLECRGGVTCMSRRETMVAASWGYICNMNPKFSNRQR